MKIRPYKITDLELVKYGYFEIFNSDYLNRIETSFQKRVDIQETIQKYAIQDTTNYHIKFIIAEETDPVGFITFSFDKKLKICNIRGIFVNKNSRNKGIAKLLMKAMYEKCSQYGMESIRVNAVDSNAIANKLYKTEGFIDIGTKLTCKI